MKKQIEVADSSVADQPKLDHERDDQTREIRPDLAYKKLLLVNVLFFGEPRNREWVLIDAGIPGSAGRIRSAAEARFGSNARPAGIVLTHGHFDHVGSLRDLAEEWDVPVYAQELEFPFLNGTAAYPAPDPRVGGGLMSVLAPLYPRGPIDVSQWLRELPRDGSVPGMPHWRWIHTPGHTPGHVSFWRDSDRTLIAGDAFITTAQESAYAVITQKPVMHGPPMYYTQNWDDAEQSVVSLANLEPELVVTGHGPAMSGPDMQAALHSLATDFRQKAVPDRGRYVKHPADVESGTAYAKPR